MAPIRCFSLLSIGLLALSVGCRSASPPVIVWEEEETGTLAELLKARRLPFDADGRGLIIPHTDDHHRALIDTLSVLRLNMQLIANNLANNDTTSDRREEIAGNDGQAYMLHRPYRRQGVVRTASSECPADATRISGVPEFSITEDPSPERAEMKPDHPHAVRVPGRPDFGMLYMPNVHSVMEMVDLIRVTRSYEQVVALLQAWERPATEIDTRTHLLEEAKRGDPDFPDGEVAKLTHFGYLGTVDTADGQIYVVDRRAVLTGMPAPRGQNYITFFDRSKQYLGKILYIDSRPLWCEGGKVYLFGQTSGAATGDDAEWGNVIDLTKGYRSLKIVRESAYGSSGGIRE